jgi:glycosyltransferase involved in cell wall biosynthesis
MGITACLIVRDEIRVIERCVTSLEGVVDNMIVHDTGSTDGTWSWLVNQDYLPFILHSQQWVNFEHNRNLLMETAADANDWLLLLDADHQIACDPDELRRLLADTPDNIDVYLVPHETGWRHYNARLVRGDRVWRYQGVTHETLVYDHARAARTDVLRIIDHADGGSRTDKLERDRKLLTEHLGQHPDDTRAVFYLARTFEDMGDWEAALIYYHRRAQMGGWEEERWWAQYRAGWMAAFLPGGVNTAMEELMAAHLARPGRAEPLARIIDLCHMNGWDHLAAFYTGHLPQQPPAEDILFVESADYPACRGVSENLLTQHTA